MVNYGVNRLHHVEEPGRRYHLFDGKDKLLLVADHGSPWLPVDALGQVRFARSSGQIVATLDLPSGVGPMKTGRIHTSYALILDHAVYAIVNEYRQETGEKPPYFTVEADGLECLVWYQHKDPVGYVLFNEIPTNLTIFDNPLESDRLETVGSIQSISDKYDFTATLPTGQFRNAALIVLALVFLVDRLDS